jgi:hypothetical protein
LSGASPPHGLEGASANDRTALDFLFRVEPPWIHVGPGEPERMAWIPTHFYRRDGVTVCVRRLRGRKMRTYESLMDEFSAALQFFDGFGENWPALEECLCYLDEWLPADAYVVVIEGAEEVLADEGVEDARTLLRVLHRVGTFWSKPIADGDRFDRPATPFHVLLHGSSGAVAEGSTVARAARDAGVPVRW